MSHNYNLCQNAYYSSPIIIPAISVCAPGTPIVFPTVPASHHSTASEAATTSILSLFQMQLTHHLVPAGRGTTANHAEIPSTLLWEQHFMVEKKQSLFEFFLPSSSTNLNSGTTTARTLYIALSQPPDPSANKRVLFSIHSLRIAELYSIT